MPKSRDPKPRDDQGDSLPGWLRNVIVGTLAGTLVVHIFVDIFRSDYDGQSTSLMLGGIVGTALGVTEWLRNRGGGPP